MKYQRVFVLTALFGALFGTAVAQARNLPSCAVVPGWDQKGETRIFEPETLFDYMNGNSEGYLIYGFQKMRGVTCGQGGATFIVDVSEMPDAESAYGLFASHRDPRAETEPIGMSGQILPQRAIYVKGNFFVEIAANPAAEDHTEALRAMAKALEAITPGEVKAPEPLSWFPVDGLDEASVRLIPQSVLGIGMLRRGYVAQYEFGRAFLIREDSPSQAAAVMEKLRKRFGQTEAVSLGDESFRTDDKYLDRLVFFRKGPYLAGFANLKPDSPQGKDSVGLAAAFLEKIP
jgi:hypothetical protein